MVARPPWRRHKRRPSWGHHVLVVGIRRRRGLYGNGINVCRLERDLDVREEGEELCWRVLWVGRGVWGWVLDAHGDERVELLVEERPVAVGAGGLESGYPFL